jgi:NAD(P)H-dependent FMN reductase
MAATSTRIGTTTPARGTSDPMSQPSVAVAVGAVTPPGRLHRAVEQGLQRVAATGVQTRTLDLAALAVGFADGRPPQDMGDDTAQVVDALRAADAVVLATPTYRGSMTGALKNLLDHVPVEALDGKPTGLVAMGASAHHFLGADRHLRDVLTFFGAPAAGAPARLSAEANLGNPAVPRVKEIPPSWARVGHDAGLWPCAR